MVKKLHYENMVDAYDFVGDYFNELDKVIPNSFNYADFVKSGPTTNIINSLNKVA